MTATDRARPGSAAAQGDLWGARARDFTTLEPKQIALYESVLERIDVGAGTRVLDVGCGPGLFLRLAAQRGATVAGIDAAAALIEIARERLPDADLTTGDMESIPYDDDSFDVITGFESFQLAADPKRALEQARRVACDSAPVVIAAWGRSELCEAAGYLRAIGSLLPPPPPGALGPFALSEEGEIEDFASRGGLTPIDREAVLCVWTFPDEEALLRGLKSTGFAVEAAKAAGEDAVAEAVLEAVAPYRTNDGGCRIENVFTYLVAHA